MNAFFLLICICVYLTCIHLTCTQDCKVGGQRCSDHELCCGGCCFDGTCIYSFRSCLETLNVCRGHVCVDKEVCTVYMPPYCAGCEPIPICKTF